MSLVLNKKKFVPSEQQKAYFNWIEVGEGSCIVEAVAGSGKTTTLIKGLEYMVGSIFFGAYNKKICDEIRAKAPAKDGLDISLPNASCLCRGAAASAAAAARASSTYRYGCGCRSNQFQDRR